MKKEDFRKIEKQYKQLIQTLKKYDHYYFVKDQPLVKDEKYDELYRELHQLEKLHPHLIVEDSPTQRVGGVALDSFQKVSHTVPMLSLQNVFSFEEAMGFQNRVKKQIQNTFKTLNKVSMDLVDFEKNPLVYYCEPKLDGLAVELIYEKGFFFQALTRGDGEVGEDVTLNAKTMPSVPLKLKAGNSLTSTFGGKEGGFKKNFSTIYQGIFEVRGEIVMLKEDFKNLNEMRIEQGKGVFSNARNAVAGAIRQLDPKVAASRPMRVYCYGVGDRRGLDLDSQERYVCFLRELGFPVLQIASSVEKIGLEGLSCLCFSMNEVRAYYEKIESLRPGLPFYIDGIVVKVNSFLFQEFLGHVNKSPRWAFAFKFKSKSGFTRVEDIVVRVGRSGILTPVAVMRPLKIDGVVIKHATLHNQSELNRKDIRKGDIVEVYRAGDVIPAIKKALIEKRISSLVSFKMPESCPVCKEKVVQDENKIDLKCVNYSCLGIRKARLKHFVSKKAMNISYLGDQLVDLLVDEGKVNDFSDLYKLKEEDLRNLKTLGLVSSQKIIKSIRASLETSLSRFIFAFGISHVGLVTSRVLASFIVSRFKGLEHFLSMEDEKIREEILKIPSIGDKVAHSILNFIRQKDFLREIEEFKKLKIQFLESESFNQASILKGKSFAITGEFEMTRDEIIDWITKLGGSYSSSVGKKTNYLLASNQKGKKYKKALELKTEIINWNDFKKMIF